MLNLACFRDALAGGVVKGAGCQCAAESITKEHPPPAPAADVARHRVARCPVQVPLPRRRLSWQIHWHPLHSAACPEPCFTGKWTFTELASPSSTDLLPPRQKGTSVSMRGTSAHIRSVLLMKDLSPYETSLLPENQKHTVALCGCYVEVTRIF